MTEKDYKEEIISMLQNIHSLRILKLIFQYVKIMSD